MARKSAYDISVSADYETFQFISASAKREINKRVEYFNTEELFDNKRVYNLAFGDVREDGEIDDEAESNNGDIVKVIGTVVATIYAYTATYPERCVFFTGSNDQRTTFYQIMIRRKYAELIEDFHIYGVVSLDGEENEYVAFNPEHNYEGFLLVRKLNDE